MRGRRLLNWTGVAEVRGPVAAVGGRVLDAQAQKLITQTFANVREQGLGMTSDRAISSRRWPRSREKDNRSPSATVSAAARRCRPTSATARSSTPTAGWKASSAARARVKSSGSRRSSSLRARHARLVSIRPDATAANTDDPEHVVVPMTCVSEGAVDVYIEPFVQARRLVVVGMTPVAERSRARRRASTTTSCGWSTRSEQRDIEARRAPLDSAWPRSMRLSRHEAARPRRPRLSSRRRATTTRRRSRSILELRCLVRRAGGVAEAWRDRAVLLEGQRRAGVDAIRNPAGLDLGGAHGAEVAVSILRGDRPGATIERRARDRAARGRGPGAPRRTSRALRWRSIRSASMDVDIATARRTRAERERRRSTTSAARSAVSGSSKDPHPLSHQPAHDRRGCHSRSVRRASGFIVNDAFATALQLVLALEKPLLVEGPAGVGKTESAKVLADVLGTRLIRLQCYEGLDALTALYEWNYPRQMLRIRLTEATGAIARRARSARSSARPFCSKRPLLEAITQDRPPVLLIDEVDRADEAFEAFLLEVLAEWQVTIPELGTIRAAHIRTSC